MRTGYWTVCRTQKTLYSGHRQKLSKNRARIACHLRIVTSQIHIQYSENPLNIAKHYVCLYISVCIWGTMYTKPLNTFQILSNIILITDYLHNTTVGSQQFLTVNHSWPIQDLKRQWWKVKKLKITNGLKYYFKADISRQFTLQNTRALKNPCFFDELFPMNHLAFFLKYLLIYGFFQYKDFPSVKMEDQNLTNALQNFWMNITEGHGIKQTM